jgi:hypothetical protein
MGNSIVSRVLRTNIVNRGYVIGCILNYNVITWIHC